MPLLHLTPTPNKTFGSSGILAYFGGDGDAMCAFYVNWTTPSGVSKRAAGRVSKPFKEKCIFDFRLMCLVPFMR